MTDKIATNLLPPDIVLSALTHEQESFPLVKEEIREFSEGEKQAFISHMGEYFRKIPGLNLSEKSLKSLSVLYSKRIPVHFVNMSVLLETREAKNHQSGYFNESLPRAVTVTLDNVDMWSYSFKDHTDYADRKHSMNILESRVVSDCRKCNTHGRLQCGRCNGQGRHTCSHCNGTMENQCGACWGRGTVSEKVYVGGGGASTSEIVQRCCIKCQGSGKTSCSQCGRSGMEQCSSCGGRGDVQCSSRDGKGRIIRSVVVIQNLTSKQKNGFVIPSDVPSNIVGSLNENDATPIARWEGNCQVNEIGPFLAKYFADTVVSSELETWFTEFVSGLGARFQIYRMEMTASKGIVNHVHYEMDGMKYDTWLYGKKQNIFSPTNPVVDHVRRLLIQAIQNWREGNTQESIKIYKSAKKISKREKSCEIAFQEAASVLPKRLVKS